MVPEKWSVTDRIFVILGHFMPFYPTNNPKNENFEKTERKNLKISSFEYHKWRSYDLWFLRYREQQT